MLLVICKDCREGANTARRVVDAGSAAPMGSLLGSQAMGRHEKCPGGTWCDCKHQVPAPR